MIRSSRRCRRPLLLVRPLAAAMLIPAAVALAGCSTGSGAAEMGAVDVPLDRRAAADQEAWRSAESDTLTGHVQLTFPDRFLRAGEAYFSPDGRRIIFQAVEVPTANVAPEANYQMYVADLVRDDRGRVTGIAGAKRLSPPGSSNTCGWFHPTEPDRVIFGSTLVPPTNPKKSGYQREGRDYAWSFPKEMDIVACDIRSADGTAATLERIVANPDAYLAECVISPDGRHLVFCERLESEGDGGDLKILDFETGRMVTVAGNSGYDGGPFFSPDGTRLCYRSDRRGNDLLQIFVAELAFDSTGAVTGLAREFQLTDNPHVNWAPFWHPGGRHLIYTTSQMGHDNYEVFAIDADPGDVSAGRPAKLGTRKRRITFARGFDGLPVFDAAGELMMWTSQRDASGSSQLWLAEVATDFAGAEPRDERVEPADAPAAETHVQDPDTGLFYIYDRATHELSVYDPKTHEKRLVTDEQEMAKAMRLFQSKPPQSQPPQSPRP